MHESVNDFISSLNYPFSTRHFFLSFPPLFFFLKDIGFNNFGTGFWDKGFFSGFCDQCSQSDDNPENTLAKFGYILHIKVEKFQILLYSWLRTGTYHEILAIAKKTFQISTNLGPFFFHENYPLYLFRSKFGKNLSVKETLPSHLK